MYDGVALALVLVAVAKLVVSEIAVLLPCSQKQNKDDRWYHRCHELVRGSHGAVKVAELSDFALSLSLAVALVAVENLVVSEIAVLVPLSR